MPTLFLLIYFVIFLAAVLGVGKWLVDKFQLPSDNKVELWVFAFGFGTIALSYFFHILGAIGALYSGVLIAGYLVVAGLSFRWLWRRRKNLQLAKLQKKIKKDTKNNHNWWWLALGAVFVFFPLIPFLFTYPLSWDVVAYHIVLPKFYLQHHWLVFDDWLAQTGFPIGIEALYGFGEAFKEPRLSQFIHASFIGTMFIYIIWGLKDQLSKPARWLAAFLLFFQPMLYTEVGISAYVDYPLAFYTLMTFVLVTKWYKSRKPLNFVALCVVLGFLPLIKFSGILLITAVVALFLWWLWKKKWSFKQIPVKYMAVSAVAFMPPLVWFVRNFYYTGNPFYPFYNEIFKGLGYVMGGKDFLKDDILLNSFVLQTLLHFKLGTDTSQDYTNLFAILFMVVGVVACIICLRAKKQPLKILAQLGLLTFAQLLVLIGPITRYVFFAFPIFAISIAYVLFDTDLLKRKIWRWITWKGVFAVAVCLVILLQLDVAMTARDKIFVSVSKRMWAYPVQDAYAKALLENDSLYRMQEYTNQHLNPKTDKVLQLLDNRMYYLDIPAEFANTIDGGYFTDMTVKTGGDIRDRIKGDGFTHLIKNDAWGAHPTMRYDLFDDFMRDYAVPVASESGHTLYMVK